jgi:bacteriocin-like protein
MKAPRTVLPQLGDVSGTRPRTELASKNQKGAAELDDAELAKVIGGVRPREKRDPRTSINLSNVTSKGNA